MGAEWEEFLDTSLGERREGLMAIGLMWNYQVVELSGELEQDEATLNPFGLIGYELVAVTPRDRDGSVSGLSQARHAPGG
jgi:hypothetical protein